MHQKIKMVRFIFLVALLLSFRYGITQQEVSYDSEGNKVIRGFISYRQLIQDTSFAWFKKNQSPYVPFPAALAALKSNKDSIFLLVFGGTWCSDTKFVLPKLFALCNGANFPLEHITIVGVDHNKKTIQHLSETFNITNIPTIIVFKNGVETGRVIEYGEHGLFDETLSEKLIQKN